MDIRDIKKGDVFVVKTNGILAWLIRLAQVIWSADSKAIYNHAGVVVDNTLTTFEALKITRQASLWRYSGKQIAIYRPIRTIDDANGHSRPISASDASKVIRAIMDEHSGQLYPIHRLVLHIFRPLSKFSYHGRFLVCSELVAKYLWMIKARGDHYPGATPDMLFDEWVRWKNMKMIFVGTFPEQPIEQRRGILKRLLA